MKKRFWLSRMQVIDCGCALLKPADGMAERIFVVCLVKHVMQAAYVGQLDHNAVGLGRILFPFAIRNYLDYVLVRDRLELFDFL